MSLDAARAAEHAKYERAYALQPNYRMKRERMEDAVRDLAALLAVAPISTCPAGAVRC